MKRMKKILKWTGIVLLFLVVALVGLTAARQNRKFDAPLPAIKASTDSAVIARGKHLVFTAAHCASCHGAAGADSLLELGLEPSLSGGREFKLPIGKMYAKNITPDMETGIGRFTDAEIARALYYGVGRNRRALFDFMPFHNLSESDMQAVISFLRTQKPVYNKVPDHNFNPLGNVVKAFLLEPTGPKGAIAKTMKSDTTAGYGGYLVNYIANCSGCHTKRDLMTGAFIGPPFAGGTELEEGNGMKFVSPNITTDSSSRIFGWPFEKFKERFRKGSINKYSPMPWASYKGMTDDELKAVYNYMQTVKPAKMPGSN